MAKHMCIKTHMLIFSMLVSFYVFSLDIPYQYGMFICLSQMLIFVKRVFKIL